MMRAPESIPQALYRALNLWAYLRAARFEDYRRSWDLRAALVIGGIVNVAAILVPRPHGEIAGFFPMIVTTLAIIGGFFGTSLSVLIGLIPRPVAENDRVQYLHVIADFCFSVSVLFVAVISWIIYISIYTTDGLVFAMVKTLARTVLIFVTVYAVLLPFSSVQRLFLISGAASIAEEESRNGDGSLR
jgi:Co/Zn/Cd efflux system component